jgi:hypothetical protein
VDKTFLPSPVVVVAVAAAAVAVVVVVAFSFFLRRKEFRKLFSLSLSSFKNEF